MYVGSDADVGAQNGEKRKKLKEELNSWQIKNDLSVFYCLKIYHINDKMNHISYEKILFT